MEIQHIFVSCRLFPYLFADNLAKSSVAICTASIIIRIFPALTVASSSLQQMNVTRSMPITEDTIDATVVIVAIFLSCMPPIMTSAYGPSPSLHITAAAVQPAEGASSDIL